MGLYKVVRFDEQSLVFDLTKISNILLQSYGTLTIT